MSAWRWLLALVLVLAPTLVHAHAQLPTSVRLVEQDDARWAVTLRRPATLTVQLVPPPTCTSTASSSYREGAELVDAIVWRCEGPLVGQRIALHGLELAALVVVVPRRGESVHALVDPSTPELEIPAAQAEPGVLARYLELGAAHLFAGADHLLFVLALVLLAARVRPLVATVTAFTAGHSLTLAAVALGGLALPQAWAELAIAITLVVVALQVLEPRPRIHGPALAGAFGLVHGLGFAGALGELGLPAHARVPALLGFNVGIELAQLALVLLAWPLWHAAQRHAPRTAAVIRRVLGWSIGMLACMWALERALQ